MQRVTEEQPHNQFALLELTRELTECSLVLAGWQAVGELLPELGGQTLFQA
jgi:hypothetical protein